MWALKSVTGWPRHSKPLDVILPLIPGTNPPLLKAAVLPSNKERKFPIHMLLFLGIIQLQTKLHSVFYRMR